MFPRITHLLDWLSIVLIVEALALYVAVAVLLVREVLL